MADAGIVNRNGRADTGAFDAVLAAFSPDVRLVAHAVRDLVFDVLPETVEVVWPKQGSVGWGIGARKFSEQFAYFLPFKKHGTLGFYYGGELADPAGLLGSGGRQVSGRLSMRSLKIERVEDVAQPALRALVVEAVRHLSAAAHA
ncbi:MAG TPA: DUF1801 domain-containing protein [Candidatus Limnocylindrales bacterium]|nr:DUF1801 domain-containing protein [Candidatus Limnocylindrales bacterium]